MRRFQLALGVRMRRRLRRAWCERNSLGGRYGRSAGGGDFTDLALDELPTDVMWLDTCSGKNKSVGNCLRLPLLAGP